MAQQAKCDPALVIALFALTMAVSALGAILMHLLS
jgi:hypothetical protein